MFSIFLIYVDFSFYYFELQIVSTLNIFIRPNKKIKAKKLIVLKDIINVFLLSFGEFRNIYYKYIY